MAEEFAKTIGANLSQRVRSALVALTGLILGQGAPEICVAQAEWSIKPRASLAYTSNANLDDSGGDGDLLLGANVLARRSSPSRDLFGRLSLTDYLSESQNDVFTWELGHSMPTAWRLQDPVEWLISLNGQHYLQGSPANSEENFDNVALRTSALANFSSHERLDWWAEAGYGLRHFAHFQDRTDHTLSAEGGMSWRAQSRHTLGGFLGLDLIRSSTDIYSKNVISFGFDWQFFMNRLWQLRSDLLIKSSTFPNRSISTVTAVSAGRGRLRTTTQTENERHSFLQVQVTSVRMGKVAQIGGTALIARQSSRSGFEDYTEMQLKIFAERKF